MENITLNSRIHGCWLGISIGGTLGLPAEGGMDRLHYRFYDPVPTIAPPNDDLELQLVCPTGEPYMPATHRPSAKARAAFTPSAEVHRMRELGSRAADQEATALLAYSNFHICPWTEKELPNYAILL